MRFLWILLTLLTLPLSAQIQERKDGQIVASVHEQMLQHFCPQEQDNWCWAACAQMVLAYHEMPMSQRTIAKLVTGTTRDRGASANEMVAALDGFQKGKRQVACRADTLINLRDVIGEIQHGNPLIIGMAFQGRQHAMVLTEIQFRKDATHPDKINPTAVVLLDPSRKYLKKRTFTWPEFYRRVNMTLHLQADIPAQQQSHNLNGQEREK